MLPDPFDGVILPHKERLDDMGEIALLVHLILDLDVGLIDLLSRRRRKGFQRGSVTQCILIGAQGDNELLDVRMKAFDMVAKAQCLTRQRRAGGSGRLGFEGQAAYPGTQFQPFRREIPAYPGTCVMKISSHPIIYTHKPEDCKHPELPTGGE